MNGGEAAQWPVIGHEWAVAQLARALHYGRSRHAYLFTGPEQIGKTTLAHTFAAALNCTGPTPPCGQCRACTLIARNAHPDLTVVEAETAGGTLKIDQVRALQQTLALRPFEARYRVAILLNFHQANPAAANALLKTLEEPSPDVVLLLTAISADLLLPTIVSRCQPLNLRPLPIQTVRAALEQHFAAPPETAQTLAQLSGGRIGWAIRALADPSALELRHEALATLDGILTANRRERFALVERMAQDKPGLLDVLAVWGGFWRDVLLVASGSRAPLTNYDRAGHIAALARSAGRERAEIALAATTRTLDLLGKNANTRLALEVLLLDYPSG
jgi:DNA polymerase-3 subunit delta'